MGVYIPPGSGSDDEGDGSSSGDRGKGKFTVPNPAYFLAHNPSFGLKLWGPLVPASDNIPALSLLTAIQIGIGMLGFSKARQLRKANLFRYNIENTFQRKFTKYICILGASYVTFESGLEISRLLLPYDPWYDEAKYYRRLATKQGERPSWWFGAVGYYKPMSYKEWSSKVERWIASQSNMIEYELGVVKGSSLPAGRGGTKAGSVTSKLAKKARYAEIYESLHENNLKTFKRMLETDLKDVNEINKGQRLDLIMEGKSDVKYNEEYSKPHIQLRNHRIDTDDDFEMVWLNFDPWEELKQETDYDIRIVTRSRSPFIENDDEPWNEMLENTDSKDTQTANEVDNSHNKDIA